LVGWYSAAAVAVSHRALCFRQPRRRSRRRTFA